MGSFTPSFAGEVAFVTGAGGGMGRAISLAFAAAGASVVAVDVDDVRGAETVAQIAAAGGTATFVPSDISDEASVAAAVEVATSKHGGLHCAVNAAAIENETVPLHECDAASFDRMQNINVRGAFLCMKHEIIVMLADVVDRLSLIGRFGTPHEIASAALWLCSDGSSFILGHALAVDAGYLAR